jgi:acyl dehydratase
MSRFFEDIRIGEQMRLGTHVFTREEIVRFARRFDPQPFHLDEGAAAAGPFGGLIASGWHTGAVWVRLMVEHRQRGAEAEATTPGTHRARHGPSPGLRELKWLVPVRPGDTISYSTRVTGKIDLASRPGWGIVVSRNEGVNQNGETVLSFLGEVFVERRAPPAQAGNSRDDNNP